MTHPNSVPLLSPRILKKQARECRLNVFLCGPGTDDPRFDIRKKLRETLAKNYHCDVVLGEDIPALKRFHKRRANLQAIEWKFAHVVDFTILILESPGAIAELGAFSRTPDIRPRLFVVIPSQHFNSNSYISRGPLSEIAEYSTNNIIYYNQRSSSDLVRNLLFPLTMYKFVKTAYSFQYSRNAISAFYGDFVPGSYEQFMQQPRSHFIDCAVLALINILSRPTFTELVRHVELDPKIVSSALHHLMKDSHAHKVAGGRYAPASHFSDPLLDHFSSTEMSKIRSRMLSMA